MAHKHSEVTLGKQIRTLFNVGAMGSMTDGVLLDHFARGGEAAEPAFAMLVERHGPMVLRVCRNLLADAHLAEDAFQTTFQGLPVSAKLSDRGRVVGADGRPVAGAQVIIREWATRRTMGMRQPEVEKLLRGQDIPDIPRSHCPFRPKARFVGG
jgi:hypothetical protein